MKAKAVYEQRQHQYEERVKSLTQSVNTYSRLRLFCFITGFGLSFYFYLHQVNGLGHMILIITVILFSVLVSKHRSLKAELTYNQTLLDINKRSLRRIDGDWHNFPDTGEDFEDDSHPYTGDLDIFGQGSLFQWLSTATTHLGRIKLQQMLTQPLTDPAQIRLRQTVVEELAQKIDWRQQFEGYGRLQSKSVQNPESLIRIGNRQLPFYLSPWLKLLTVLLPGITIILLIATALGAISYLFPVFLLLIQSVLVLYYRSEERSLALSTVSKFKNDLKTYKQMLRSLESAEFSSPYLNELQQSLRLVPSSVDNSEQHLKSAGHPAKGVPAYRQIEQLERLSDWIANRHNPFYLIFNILFLWDYHFMYALERWKQRSGPLLERWLNAIGELEALNSLALIRHDHPDWAFPVVSADASFHYVAKKLGHPLIHDRVTNDFTLTPPQQVLLITGSNMSGKSTFLRTAGINLVLAYAGAPVCADSMRCSMFKVYTCMRISDNLEKNISTFYAEILRIKTIVKAATREHNIFFLLDEIFKGTNSIDRHTGAQILIKRLMNEGAVGLVSTHDLELGAMEQKYAPKVKNYHFREYYVNDEIKFDYRLRPGLSTTRNALYLIKMAGIPLN